MSSPLVFSLHRDSHHHHRYRRQLSHLSQLSNSESSHLLRWHYTEFDDRNFQIHGQTLFYLFILFSIILLVTLLLLYARWYLRFRHLHAPPSLPHAPPPSAAPARPPVGGACRGLDPAAVKSIPILLHQESSAAETECCICLGLFEDGDKVKVLPKCDHRFHSDCVDRWLLAQASCPLCRISLRIDSPSESPCLEAVV